MAYKNPNDERAKISKRKHYEKNKQVYIDRAKRRQQFIKSFIKNLKESNPCPDCGINYAHYIMEFDHIPGHTKVDTINNLRNLGNMHVLEEEIKKCEIVCSNCHRKRTYERSLKK